MMDWDLWLEYCDDCEAIERNEVYDLVITYDHLIEDEMDWMEQHLRC
jgi:hypothetical protein